MALVINFVNIPERTLKLIKNKWKLVITFSRNMGGNFCKMDLWKHRFVAQLYGILSENKNAKCFSFVTSLSYIVSVKTAEWSPTAIGRKKRRNAIEIRTRCRTLYRKYKTSHTNELTPWWQHKILFKLNEVPPPPGSLTSSTIFWSFFVVVFRQIFNQSIWSAVFAYRSFCV